MKAVNFLCAFSRLNVKRLCRRVVNLRRAGGYKRRFRVIDFSRVCGTFVV